MNSSNNLLPPQVTKTPTAALAKAAAAELELRRRRKAQERALYNFDDPVHWIEKHFYIPETQAPITLEPYQRDFIRAALARDEAGLFRYSMIVWGDIKKSAKSTIAGAIALWMAMHNPNEIVRIVANDLNQAYSRTYAAIETALKLHPHLSKSASIRLYRITLPNRTKIRAIPVDPKGEAGGGDLVTCFTEVWAMSSNAAMTLYTETTTSPLKYGKSFRLFESYAGHVGESLLLEKIYDLTVTGGEQIGDDPAVYRNTTARTIAMWNTKPRCSWQTPEYYASEALTLTPNEFQRIHRNEWVQATNTLVPPEWWAACERPLPEIHRLQNVAIGIDAGVSSDCFAMVAVCTHYDVVTKSKSVVVLEAHAWQPTHNQKVDFNLPRAMLVDLARKYKVVAVVYDPYMLHEFAMSFMRSGKLHMREFGQGAPRLEADKMLYDLIRERRIMHDQQPTLTQHILNANAKTDGDKGLRLIKRRPQDKIDLAVALSMAAHTAMTFNL
jgi:phage terminase large subunit-like protein